MSKTIDLPFSPEGVAAGRVKNEPSPAKMDKAWEIVMHDPELAFARQRLSFHELRHIIAATAAAFS